MRRASTVVLLLLQLGAVTSHGQPSNSKRAGPPEFQRTIIAEVVALDQVYMYNRLGSAVQDGMIYALRRDVVDKDGNPLPPDLTAEQLKNLAGAVRLRPDKRPRPLVLRANVGDCLEIRFTNLFAETPAVDPPITRGYSARRRATPAFTSWGWSCCRPGTRRVSR